MIKDIELPFMYIISPYVYFICKLSICQLSMLYSPEEELQLLDLEELDEDDLNTIQFSTSTLMLQSCTIN